MMRCLRFARIPLLLLLVAAFGSCSKAHYGSLKADPDDTGRLLPGTFSPERSLYRCSVDGRFLFKRFHLSGLLLFKALEDSSTRVVFANESGLTFFDFGWSGRDSFYVVRIIPQLDRRPVIKTLRKDLELILYKGLDRATEQSFKNTSEANCCGYAGNRRTERWHRFRLEKGYVYYVQVDSLLRRIETTNGSRPVTTIALAARPDTDLLSDSISVVHHRAHFTITAKKLSITNE